MMYFEEKIKHILEICERCIIVVPRIGYDKHGNRYNDGLTIVGESSKCIGHSHGIGTRYDYGFMQQDIANGISVVILN